MNERFIRKQLYQVGQFYQIDSFNPVYLDKTGELIASSEGKLKNWNGNLDEFLFKDENDKYDGKVNMHNYWYRNPRQGDFDEKDLHEFTKFIEDTNGIITGVYNPKYYTRIGLRLQFILKKTSSNAKDSYKRFFDDRFTRLAKYGTLNSNAIGFDIDTSGLLIKININYAIRNSDNDINAPKDGLFFDLDFHKILDRNNREEAFSANNNMFIYALDNYTEIISSLAEDLGIINEN